MTQFRPHALTFTLLCTLLPSLHSQAQSSLMITTPRVVVEGRERSASVHLKNAGDSTGSYRVFFREKSMTDNGTVKKIASDAQPAWSAATMIRFSPRRVTLAPQQSQRVRLALRKPANLADGEYRSHLVFRSEPENLTRQSNTSQISTQFRPTFEFSIPVIIRHGRTFATAALSDPALIQQDKRQVLRLTLNRTGNRSLYGDFQVSGLQSTTDSGTTLFEQKGLALYPPLNEREVQLELPKNIPLQQYSHLKVVFQERPKYGGNERAELMFSP